MIKNLKWGLKPLKIIKKSKSIFKNKEIIDLGIGNGRNSIYLLKKGFKIIGIDKNKDELDKIINLDLINGNNKYSNNLELINKNFSEYLKNINNITNLISTFTLRFDGKNFHKNIDIIKDKTEIGGINVIVDFIESNNGFSKDKENNNWYFLKENELLEIYKDWQIIYYEEKNTRTRTIDKNGDNTWCNAGYLIVKKR